MGEALTVPEFPGPDDRPGPTPDAPDDIRMAVDRDVSNTGIGNQRELDSAATAPIPMSPPLHGAIVTDETIEPTRSHHDELVRLAGDRALLLWAEQGVRSLRRCDFDAKDIVQEALSRMAGRTIGPRGAQYYAYKTVSSIIASHGRRNSSAGRLTGYRSSFAVEDEIIDHGAQAAMERIEQTPTWAAVQALPQRERETILLRFYLDLSVADTAELMGVSVGTVKSSSSRALATLKIMLTGMD